MSPQVPTAKGSLTSLPDKEVKAAFRKSPLVFFPAGGVPMKAIMRGWKRTASGELAGKVRNPLTNEVQLYCIDHLSRQPYPLTMA